jgi:polyadenylate-binding protein
MMSFLRYVGKFIARKERMKELGHHTRFTNVFVKNFGDDFSEDQLRETFSAFGMIISAVVMKDDRGKGRGFGFVSYEDHEAASKVCPPSWHDVTYSLCG